MLRLLPVHINFSCSLFVARYGSSECGDDDVELLVRERRSLDILSMKKEARLSARALAEVQVGRGEEELRYIWYR